MSDRVPYRDGIQRQPASLRDGLASLPAQLDAARDVLLRTGTIALVGIGASLYAAQVGAAHLRRLGARAFALPGTDLTDPATDPADCYVALSASGRSVEPARAMEVRPKAATFGISKRRDVPLASVVRTMLSTESGPDGGPNTTSYVGTLLALGLLADRVAREPAGADWASLPDRVASLLHECRPAVARAAALLAGRTAIDCVGEGAAFGTAGYASLLMREAVRVPAQQWDTLNYLHGPMEPNDSRTGVLLFGDGREVRLAQDLAGFGIASVLVTTRADVPDQPSLVVIPVPGLAAGVPDAIVQSLPAQLLVADMMEQAGLPVCEFRYRQTDTKLT